MKNSEKPKKKKFSIFCCFSMNNDRRKRKIKNSMNPLLTGNRTNNTEQNLNIKVNEFDFDANDKQSKNTENEEKRMINSYISQKIPNIKEDDKNGSIVLYKNNINKKNYISFISGYDPNNDKKNNKLERYMNRNRTLLDKKSNEPIIILNNQIKNNNIKEKLDNSNLSKIKKGNNYQQIQTSNKEEINTNENNMTTNKEKVIHINNKLNIDITNKEESNFLVNEEKIYSREKNESKLINKLPFKKYQNNTIEKNEKVYKVFSFYDKENKELNLYDKYNYNINIYDNNSNQIPNLNIEEISPIKNNKEIKFYNNSTNNEIKDKNINEIEKKNFSKIISLFSSSNKNQNKQISKNNNINIGKLKGKLFYNLNNQKNNKNKSYCIFNTNIIDSFLYLSNELKYSKSDKLIKRINIDNINSFILKNNNINKTNLNENSINEKLDYINTNNINYITKENNISNFSPEKSRFNYRVNRLNSKSSKKKYNKLPLTKIGKKLQSMNDCSFIFKNSKSIEISKNLTYIQHSQEKENINKLSNKSKIFEKFNSVQITEYNNIINKNKTSINKIQNGLIKKIEVKADIKDLNVDVEDGKEESEIKIINDSKSNISNYIVSPLMGVRHKSSFSPSVFSKSEIKINLSHTNYLQSSKGSLYASHAINEEEIEIMNRNGKEYKSFLDTPRTSENYSKRLTRKKYFYNSVNKNSTNYGFNRSISTQIGSQIKNINDKINYNINEIKLTKEKIGELNKKIEELEECNKTYKLWIEKEEMENEMLMTMLNFLNSNNIY